MVLDNIRNFCIIAHVDHGKTTLSDRILELTHAVSARELKEQTLDAMDLERERGITIKSHPVSMHYTAKDGKTYLFNLLDTPGHVDFAYEVSRSMGACEGALLVVDAAQGVEAQTVANTYFAQDAKLEIVPVLNKVDLPGANVDEVSREIEDILAIPMDDPLLVSAKTGMGCPDVLEAIVKRIPPPETMGADAPLRALVFDSVFDEFRGVITYVRVVDGTLKAGQSVLFMASGVQTTVHEVGVFSPDKKPVEALSAGQVGYIVGTVKDPSEIRIGDTVTTSRLGADEPLPGFRDIHPTVFCGIYPMSTDEYPKVEQGLEKLHLNDSAFTFHHESSLALGFGFRCGFLGLLHMEIVQERLRREFGLDIISTSPGVVYKLKLKNGEEKDLDNPLQMPDPSALESIAEPTLKARIITPSESIGDIMRIVMDRRGTVETTETIDAKRVMLHCMLPLNEILIDFHDTLKSVSHGYASMDYEPAGYQYSDIVKMDILLNGETVDAFATLVHRDKARARGLQMCKALADTIPPHQFKIPVQAAIGREIIAREDIRPFRKDVLAKLYGGDVTRKMKVLEKQKRGKARMKEFGHVNVPQSAFIAVLKGTLALAAAVLFPLVSPAVDRAAMEKAMEILPRMTLEEKVSLCAGSGTMTLPALPRLGITNEWTFSDSSHTVRADMERWTWNCSFTNDEATVLPTLSALASTWNVEMSALFGDVLGSEARARGKDMMLGPGVNIMRTPLCGRNWEYMGEDPILAARLVVPEIRAIQAHDVAACVKHFCVNSQEKIRTENNAVVDDRTLNEIYLPVFRAAVKEAGVYSLMTSYNLHNGVRCAQSPYLIKGILRERWGFDGMIVTDWGGQRSTVKSALSGAGVECNNGSDIRYLANPKEGTYPLADAVRQGKVPESVVDEKALRVLYTMARTKFLNPAGRKGGERLTRKHSDAALAIAEEAMILLKNDAGLLPIDPGRVKKIVLAGKLADTEMTRRGWSAEGKPPYETTPFKGLVEYFGKHGSGKVEIVRMPLAAGETKDVIHPVNEDSIATFDTSAVDQGMSIKAWKRQISFSASGIEGGEKTVRGFSRDAALDFAAAAELEQAAGGTAVRASWSARIVPPETGVYLLGCKTGEGGAASFSIDGKKLEGFETNGVYCCETRLSAGEEFDFEVSCGFANDERFFSFGWLLPSERGNLEDLKKEAENADAVLLFTGTEIGHGRGLECEGGDRPDMRLPAGQDEAVLEILSWGLANVVVVNHSGSPVEMPWADRASTILQQPYTGQEAGRALARTLFGDVNPSGRLPYTWPVLYSDTAVATVGEITDRHSIYNERFYVGYRWFDKQGIKPLFPFGYGLSYTTFEISDVSVSACPDGFAVKARIKNTGRRAGKEVFQVYASYPSAKVERCVKELKGFAKTGLLSPGESEEVTVSIPLRDLAYWDPFRCRFVTERGEYILLAGTDSAHLSAHLSVQVADEIEYRD